MHSVGPHCGESYAVIGEDAEGSPPIADIRQRSLQVDSHLILRGPGGLVDRGRWWARRPKVRPSPTSPTFRVARRVTARTGGHAVSVDCAAVSATTRLRCRTSSGGPTSRITLDGSRRDGEPTDDPRSASLTDDQTRQARNRHRGTCRQRDCQPLPADLATLLVVPWFRTSSVSTNCQAIRPAGREKPCQCEV
jgi:hypothetical protein